MEILLTYNLTFVESSATSPVVGDIFIYGKWNVFDWDIVIINWTGV